MAKVSARTRIDLEPHDEIGGQSIVEYSSTLGQRKLERNARFDVTIRLDLEPHALVTKLLPRTPGDPGLNKSPPSTGNAKAEAFFM